MARGPVLTGELVQLRPVEERDAERMWESLQDAESNRLTGTTRTFTREEIDEWARTVSDREGRYDFAMTSLMPGEDGSVCDEMIGEIVVNEIDPVTRSANMRLISLPQYRGRGYGREAIALVLDFVFAPPAQGLGLHRFSLDVLAINPRAKMLYESLGFVQEGVLRGAAPDGEGGFCDVYVMSILEDEYDPQR
jgi:RimJ/RimL family protein N-acetyltransferase